MKSLKDSLTRFGLSSKGLDEDTELAKESLSFLTTRIYPSTGISLFAHFKTMEPKDIPCGVCKLGSGQCTCNLGYQDLKGAVRKEANGSSKDNGTAANFNKPLPPVDREEEEETAASGWSRPRVDLPELSPPHEQNDIIVDDDDLDIDLPVDIHGSEEDEQGSVSIAQKILDSFNQEMEAGQPPAPKDKKKTTFLKLSDEDEDSSEEDKEESSRHRDKKDLSSPSPDLERVIRNMLGTEWASPLDLFSSKVSLEITYATMLVVMERLLLKISSLESDIEKLKEDANADSSNLISILQSLDDRMNVIPNQIKSLMGSNTEIQNKILELKTGVDLIDNKVNTLSIVNRATTDATAKVKLGCPEAIFTKNLMRAHSGKGYSPKVEEGITKILSSSFEGKTQLEDTLASLPLTKDIRETILKGFNSIRSSYDSPKLEGFWTNLIKILGKEYSSEKYSAGPSTHPAVVSNTRPMKSLAQSIQRSEGERKTSILDNKGNACIPSVSERKTQKSLFDEPEMM